MISTPLPDSALLIALSVTAFAALLSVVGGSVHDLARWRSKRVEERTHRDLAVVVFGADTDAAAAVEHLSKRHRQKLLALIQRLSADLSGDALLRLRQLVAGSALDRHIQRRLNSRLWRRRAQGAGSLPYWGRTTLSGRHCSTMPTHSYGRVPPRRWTNRISRNTRAGS